MDIHPDYVKVKPLSQRVADGFAAPETRAFGEKYLELVLAGWTEIETALRRTIILIVVLVVAFLLLADAKTTEFDLGPLTLSDVTGVLTLVPAIVSFLYFEFVVLLTAGVRYRRVRDALVENLHPDLYENDLEKMLFPPVTSVLGFNRWRLPTTPGGAIAKTVEILAVGTGLLLFFGALGFLVYAYQDLLANEEADTAAVTVSAVFASFNVVRAFLMLSDDEDVDDDDA